MRSIKALGHLGAVALAAFLVACPLQPEAAEDERACTASNHCSIVGGAAECHEGYDWLNPDGAAADYRCVPIESCGADCEALDAGQNDLDQPDRARPDSARPDSARPDSAQADGSANPCQGECVQLVYTACTCGPDDPCDWSGDGYCDLEPPSQSCDLFAPHFDDSLDCDSPPDAGVADSQLPDANTTADSAQPDAYVCARESDAELCSRLGRTCGEYTGDDSCDEWRSVSSCGTCDEIDNGSSSCGSDGTCALECDETFHLCDGACLSDSSVLSCGASCTACPEVENGSPSCDGVACGIRCDVGYRPCPGGDSCCPWTVETIAGGAQFVSDASIALDLSGEPHVVYYDQDREELRHTRRSDASWSSTPILELWTCSQTDLACDSTGTLHLVAEGYYLTYSDAAWSEPEWFAGAGEWSTYAPKLLLDGTGTVQVAYLKNASNSPIEVATRTADGWEVETVEEHVGGDYNDELAAKLDATGQPALFYRTDGAYHFATRSTQGTWSVDSVEPTGRYYATVSMQQTAVGFALLYGDGYGSLAMVEGAPGAWSALLASSGWGLLADAPVGDVRLVHIGYSSLNAPTPLKVETRHVDRWSTQTIDDGVPDGSSVTDALVDEHGALWFLLSGHQRLRLYH